MSHWSLDDIPWDRFDPSRVDPHLLSIVKAASMVEYNSADYSRYLSEVFADDEAFKAAAGEWAVEEIQHGAALRRWAEMADPSFDFEHAFKVFTTGYRLPQNVAQSVRGSRTGELIARCVVEAGTSSYYSAIRDRSDEPVLKAVCAKIAADEFRHYKLFYTHLGRYLDQEKVGFFGRLKVALGRIAESEDDELAYAFYAAHQGGGAYDRQIAINRYFARAMSVYRKGHLERMIGMVLKAAGLKANGNLNRVCTLVAWKALQWRLRGLRRYLGQTA